MKKVVVHFSLLLVLMLASRSVSGQSERWSVVHNMLIPTAGGRAVVRDSLIYILGGYLNPGSISSSLTDMVQIYDPKRNSWRLLSESMDAGRAGFVAGIYRDNLYYCGGIWNLSGPPLAFSITRWDFTSAPVSLNFSPEFNRRNTTGLVYRNNLYLIGGLPAGDDPPAFSYIAEFDLDASAFTFKEDSLFDLSDLPYDQMSTRIGDDIYIFGGVRFGISRDIFKFNTIDYSLVKVGEMNRERAGGVALAVEEGDIYLIGGYNENFVPAALDSVTVFSRENGFTYITKGPNLNINRLHLMAAAYENSIYVFGGVGQQGIIESSVEKLDIATAIESPDPIAIHDFRLFQNYPNPFNAITTIRFHLGKPLKVRIDVYSVSGQHIVKLLEENKIPGDHEIRWNGRDQSGRAVGSGIYIYHLTAGRFSDSKKMILVK